MNWRENQSDCSRWVLYVVVLSSLKTVLLLPLPPPPPLQGSLKVYPLPDDGSKEPPPVFSKTINTKPVECVVRVYVVRVSLVYHTVLTSHC